MQKALLSKGISMVSFRVVLAIYILCLASARLPAGDVFTAAEQGDLAALKQAVAQMPACLKQKNTDGWTPLQVAARFGKTEAVAYLADQKAEVDAADTAGWTALLLAAKYSQTGAGQILIERKADVNRRSPTGDTALHLALFNDNSALAMALIAAGAKPNVIGAEGRSPLYMAVEADDPDLKVIAALLDKGAQVDLGVTTISGNRWERNLEALAPLHRAILNGDLKVVQILVEHGADLENLACAVKRRSSSNLEGLPSLLLAVQLRQTQIAAYLTAHGANLDVQDRQGRTPLHYAVMMNSPEILRALLEHKADPNRVDQDGCSPLTLATDVDGRGRQGNPQLAELLKAHGARENPDGDDQRMARMNNVAAIQNLKALATAQAQFIKKQDYYSESGANLHNTGTLIAADLAAAFETFQGNGDPAGAKPKAGYVYRMLQGDDAANPTSFYRDAENPRKGMNTWGCTCRPANGKGFQYFISEVGTVYRKKDPGDGKFLLIALPTFGQEREAGWEIAR